MCIGLVVTNFPPHSPIKKLILFNRDEALSRPTFPLHKNEDGFFAGTDVRSQGTWLAFTPTKFAFITFLFDIPFQPVSGALFRRGKIVKEVLKGDSKLLTEDEILKAF